jgi:hypothetical protein
MVESKPLTANSSIGTWLHPPEGGPLIRELLALGGFDESTLAPCGICRCSSSSPSAKASFPRPLSTISSYERTTA